MAKKRLTAEQSVTLLRQIEVATSQGKSIAIACREAGITDQTYYRWRKEYGGLDLEQARQMKDLEKENSRLKRLVADLSLEKQVLKDVTSGNVWSAPLLQGFGEIVSDSCVNVSGLSRVGCGCSQAMMRS